eukprot:6075444-Pyramimonas_sp.AAC.1
MKHGYILTTDQSDAVRWGVESGHAMLRGRCFWWLATEDRGGRGGERRGQKESDASASQKCAEIRKLEIPKLAAWQLARWG